MSAFLLILGKIAAIAAGIEAFEKLGVPQVIRGIKYKGVSYKLTIERDV